MKSFKSIKNLVVQFLSCVLLILIVACSDQETESNHQSLTQDADLVSIRHDAEVKNPSAHLIRQLYQPKRGQVLIVPHRGHWRQAPENSIRAIQESLQLGVILVEIDIRETADGHFVLIHDKTLDRTTTGKGRVNHHTYEQLKSFRLRNGYGLPTDQKIPSLIDALTLVEGHALLYLDKSDGKIKDVVRYLNESDLDNSLDRVVFYGRKSVVELEDELGETLYRIHYMPKVGDRLDQPDQYVQDFLTTPGLNIPGFILDFATLASPVLETVPLMTEQDKHVWMSPLWTDLTAGLTDDAAVDDPDKNWGKLIQLGATMLCTDRPSRLKSYLDSRVTLVHP